MAESYQISISDRATAMQWLDTVTALNEDYHTAMREATECLASVNEAAEGTLIDELVQFGTDLCNAGETIFDAVSSIAQTVTGLVSAVENFVDEAAGFLGNAISNIFG